MRRIVMIGSGGDVHGGVSAVTRVYGRSGLLERWRVAYLATHRDGSRGRKALAAATAWLAFAARLLAGRVGLLHVHLATGASFWRKSLFIAPAAAMGVPYVLHLHTGELDRFHARQAPWARRWIARVLERASAVIALSTAARSGVLAIAPRARTMLLANPVCVPAWQATLRDGPPTVAFLSVVKRAKGIEELLRAWALVHAAVPAARLEVAGSGDLDAARALASRLGLEASVRFHGWLGADAKEALLRSAWVVALPSHAEGLPMSVLEAMAAGVPVVGSAVGGIPDAVEHRKSGLLVPPGRVAPLADALVALLVDEERRIALGAAARARVSEIFSAEAALPKLEALWREIVPESEAAPGVNPPREAVVRSD